jgi:RNA polymerase sigma-70 factor (ECF subfamily)
MTIRLGRVAPARVPVADGSSSATLRVTAGERSATTQGNAQEALVAAAANGDPDAFSLLARSVSDRLYAIASRTLRDRYAAEDAVQDALVEIWRDLRGLRDPTRFQAWATRILVRCCQRQVSRSSRAGWLPERVERADDQSARIAERDRVEQAFAKLTTEQRTILVLRYYADMEPADIADVLGIPGGTARSRLHNAHAAMRAALDAADRGPQPQGLTS